MSEWLKIELRTFEHPKTRRLARRLGCPAAAAVGYMASLWGWAQLYAPDGRLGAFDPEELEIGAGWEGEYGAFVAATVAAGYLDETPAGLAIHDWTDWGGRLVEMRAAERQRSAKRRAAKGRPPADRSTTAGRPLANSTDSTEHEQSTTGHAKKPRPAGCAGHVNGNAGDGDEIDNPNEGTE